VQSLASEHLQEIENLVGSEREKQEEIIKVTTGSMYAGEALYYNGSGTWHLLDLFSAGSDTVRISYNPVRFFTEYYNEGHILDEFLLSGSSTLSAGTKTSTGRTRCCSWKRPATHVR
jgi:hypothetical protein